MIHKLYVIVSNYAPRFRKFAFRIAYDALSRFAFSDRPVTFLNYGYADENTPEFQAALGPDDRDDHLSIRLYTRLLDGLDVANKRVLDVGCGRGGGTSYIARYLHPAKITGVDYSARSIVFCHRHHRVDNLDFQIGDAEKLPFESGSMDIIINVESSHCYRDVSAFLANARRILAPGGVLCFCDVRPSDRVEELNAELANCGLCQMWRSDISANILLALQLGSEAKSQMVERMFPSFLSRSVTDWSGVEGGTTERSFAAGTRTYIACVLQKPGNLDTLPISA